MRFLAVVAVVASLLVVAPGAASAQTGGSSEDGLSDMAGDLHEPAIEVLAGQGLFEGTLCGEMMFCPGEPVTRSTVAVWLVRALGAGTPAVGVSRFADVDADEWWAGHVERLAALEVAVGCGTDPLSYCPDDPLTRAELASWLVRAFDLPDAPPGAYFDVEGNAHEADIAALAAAGIAVGCERDPLSFCPDDPVTRGQSASFLARALGLVPPPPEFTWSLPSHCSKRVPRDPHGDPEAGCPAWWGHLLDLEPSEEGITVAEMEARLHAALPFYTPRLGDNLGGLPAPTREVIAATLTRLAADDPTTAATLNRVGGQSDRCGENAAACAFLGGMNFVPGFGRYPWLTAVEIIVHEWVHSREWSRAPGGLYSTGWCNTIVERLSVAESTGRLVTHMGLLEAAGPAHQAPLVSGWGCGEALIARFGPEIDSHDRLGYVAELSANAQTQVWMRRGYASPEARWWAAEAAAGYPTETQPLETPLPLGEQPEPPAPSDEPDESDEPPDCNDGMHDHPFVEGARHYHSDGLEPHTHHRRHIIVDGVAVPSDTPEPVGTHCEYPDGRRVVSQWGAWPGVGPGDVVTVWHEHYSPDGQWHSDTARRCVDITTPGHPRHDPSAEEWTWSALQEKWIWSDLQQVCDYVSDSVWLQCGASDDASECPTEAEFADGAYDGDWVACGPPRSNRLFEDICRWSNGQPRAR